jgi:hypothetical protein
MRCLDRYPPSAAFQFAWRSVIEQIGWKIRAADQVQLRQFLLHAGEAEPPWIATQFQERRGHAAWNLSSHRTIAFTLGRAQQLVKTLAHRRRQPPVDIGVKMRLLALIRRPSFRTYLDR